MNYNNDAICLSDDTDEDSLNSNKLLPETAENLKNELDHAEEIERKKNILKVNSIVQECINFITNISKSLSQLEKYKDELTHEFSQNQEILIKLADVFRDIVPLHSVYEMIINSIMEKKNTNQFYLGDIFLDEKIKHLLKFNKPFLCQYADNSKWIMQFIRSNDRSQKACLRALQNSTPDECLSLEGCHYSVFNSLFSLELMFERYSKCFHETDDEYKAAIKVKSNLREILISVPQDQESFIKTHHELNLLIGKSRIAEVNTKFISKVFVKKYSRKDNVELTRQLLLFSDCLYVAIPFHNESKVRQELSLKYMNVSVIPNDVVKRDKEGCGLNINTLEMNKEFYFDDKKTLENWKDLIQSAINSVNKLFDNRKPPENLGKTAPIWQKDSSTDYCNGLNCLTQFSTTNRRHHCRADGLIYCNSCSSNKFHLEFEESTNSRVCDLCYKILSEAKESPNNVALYRKDLETIFERKTRNGRKWSWMKVCISKSPRISGDYFCELNIEHPVLKLYKNSEDKIQFHQILLVGMKIVTGRNSRYYPKMKPNQFTIEHNDKDECYLFKLLNVENCKEWVNCLQSSLDDYCRTIEISLNSSKI